MTGSVEEFGKYPIYIGVIITLCVIALLLNVLVIYFVIIVNKYKACTDIFLTNLAFSDIIHVSVVTPVHLRTAALDHEDFYGGNAVCKIVMFIPLLTIMSAILTIVAMAIDRYRSIILKKQIFRRGAVVVTFIIWIASFLFTAPQLYEYNIYIDPENNFTACGSKGIVENFETIYASIAFCCGYVIPLLIIFVCYAKLLVFIWKHGKNFQLQTTTQHAPNRLSNMASARMLRVLKMLISITISFVLLWTPYFLLFVLTEVTGLDDSSKLGEWPHVTSRLMTVLSTISNPVLYLAFDKKLREKILLVVGKRDNRSVGTNRVHPLPPAQRS